jgi:hypothetical protein
VGVTDYTEIQIGVADSLLFGVELVTVANMLFLCCVILLCAPLSALPLGDRHIVVSVCVCVCVCVLSSVSVSCEQLYAHDMCSMGVV